MPEDTAADRRGQAAEWLLWTALTLSALPLDIHGVEVGYRAEARLLALLATEPRLNAFKAFPDLEMVEYCVRHVGTGGIAGIQVKAISVDSVHRWGTIKVPPHTYRPTRSAGSPSSPNIASTTPCIPAAC